MRLLNRLRRDQAGAPAVEFAFAAPVLFTLVIGIIQLGMLFGAYAGLSSAVNEGARYATLYPTPSDTQIVDRMKQMRFMMKATNLQVATPVRATENGVPYVELTATYSAPLDFIFFTTRPIRLQQTRRAWLS